MTKYNLSQIMKDAHSLYNNKFQRGNKTFGECLACAWRWANNDIKAREEREARIQEVIAKSWKENETNKNKVNPYNDVNIPSSAFYSGNKGYMGAKYVGD